MKVSNSSKNQLCKSFMRKEMHLTCLLGLRPVLVRKTECKDNFVCPQKKLNKVPLTEDPFIVIINNWKIKTKHIS